MLLGTASGAVDDLSDAITRQMEAKWDWIWQWPDECGSGRLLAVRRDGHGRDAARLLFSSSLAAALMGRLSPEDLRQQGCG